MGITHRTTVAVADDGTSPVGTDEWHETHKITTDLSPETDSSATLGTSDIAWSKLYLSTGGSVNFRTCAITGTSSGVISISGSTVEIIRCQPTGPLGNPEIHFGGITNLMGPKFVIVGADERKSSWTDFSEHPNVQILGTDGETAALAIAVYKNTTDQPRLWLSKSRGTTISSEGVVQLNDPLGFINWSGADGNTQEIAARIAAYVDGTPGNQDMPGRLSFQTTPDGSDTPVERLQINSVGAIIVASMGTTDPGVAGQFWNSSGSVKISSGT